MRAWVPSSMSAEQARDSVALTYLSEEDVDTGEVTEVTEERGAMLVQVNSEAAYVYVPEEVRAQGVIFSSLEEAVRRALGESEEVRLARSQVELAETQVREGNGDTEMRRREESLPHLFC